MWRIPVLIFFGISICCKGLAQSHGLQFSSHEVVPEKRTSLNLTPGSPLCLEGNSEISFDLIFTPHLETYFGYIMRMVTADHQNIDLVYNQRLLNFNFVIGEKFSGVFKIDSAQLFGRWNNFSIRFTASGEASFFLNNKFVCKGNTGFGKSFCARIAFGTSDFEGFQMRDIPPMSIKNIRIAQQNKLLHYYPLSESSGLTATDSAGNSNAVVKNAAWVKPKHQKWDRVLSFETHGTPSIAFDQKNDVVYVVAEDSLYEYPLKINALTGTALSASHRMLPAGNQSVFDPLTNRLYNFHIDEKKISSYDPVSKKWDVNFATDTLTIFWHANKFLSPLDSSLYFIGGYGQLRYKNSVQRVRLNGENWETVPNKGDEFTPRYLAAAGTNSTGDTAYILGGFGSISGEQTINPKYNYELLAFSVRDQSFKKIYQLKEPATQFCFANSLITIPGSSEYYALTYPTDRFNSALQLIRGSLTKPEYQLMADSIPYPYHDIESFSDLFYSPSGKKLIAVTMFTRTKERKTQINIYSLDFPPNPIVATPVEPNQWSLKNLLALGIPLVAILIFLVARFRSRKKPENRINPTAQQMTTAGEEKQVASIVDLPAVANGQSAMHAEVSSIFLFNQFEVFDRGGNEITRQFTPLLRELFLLILIHTFRDGKGISPEKIFETLWPDKPLKDARNNFSVNLVKLKSILEKAGEYHINKEGGKSKMEIIDNSIYVDYQQFIRLMNEGTSWDKARVNELLTVISRGAFLPNIHYHWLDDIKSGISGQIIDLLIPYMNSIDLAQEPEFILRISQSIFAFDQLNEEALSFKCKALIVLGRHGMAHDTYQKFAREYQENYGQSFEKSFTAVTS